MTDEDIDASAKYFAQQKLGAAYVIEAITFRAPNLRLGLQGSRRHEDLGDRLLEVAPTSRATSARPHAVHRLRAARLAGARQALVRGG
jgi:hypothetical protein